MSERSRLRGPSFSDLDDILKPGDLLIANDTQVIPALLFGVRQKRDRAFAGINVQVNLLEQDHMRLEVPCTPRKALKEGDVMSFQEVLFAQIRREATLRAILIEFLKEASVLGWSAEDWRDADSALYRKIPSIGCK